MNDAILATEQIVVVGAGMVAHRLVQSLIGRAETRFHVTVIGDEGLLPYDRVALTGVLAGASGPGLELDCSVFDDFRVRFLADDRVVRVDREARTVRTRSRLTIPYDTLVLATGSYAVTPEIDGADLDGCFVVRTVDDVEHLKTFSAQRETMIGRGRRAAVIGGGQPALEAVDALAVMGVESKIFLHTEPFTSPQLDRADENLLPDFLDAVRADAHVDRIVAGPAGTVTALMLDDGTTEPVDLVVFAAGVRPRDELARNSSMRVAPAGGIVVDERCRTSDPHIVAVGEVACFQGRCLNLLEPGLAMAEVATTRILGGDAVLRSDDDPSRPALRCVEIVNVGDAANPDRYGEGWRRVSQRPNTAVSGPGRGRSVRSLRVI
jgi:nitrite reductase (NADH) large subunit